MLAEQGGVEAVHPAKVRLRIRVQGAKARSVPLSTQKDPQPPALSKRILNPSGTSTVFNHDYELSLLFEVTDGNAPTPARAAADGFDDHCVFSGVRRPRNAEADGPHSQSVCEVV